MVAFTHAAVRPWRGGSPRALGDEREEIRMSTEDIIAVGVVIGMALVGISIPYVIDRIKNTDSTGFCG